MIVERGIKDQLFPDKQITIKIQEIQTVWSVHTGKAFKNV